MTDFDQKLEMYREKKAKNTSIAVMLYILSVVVLIGFSCFFPINGGVIGVLLMLAMIAIATGLIVYTSMTTPKDVAAALDATSREVAVSNSGKASLFESISKLYWSIVTIVYLGVSFLTSAWHITWLIWLIATAIEQALKIIFEIKSSDNQTSDSNNS